MPDNTGELQTVTSFDSGAVAEIGLSEKFSFQPELIYSGQGFSIGKEGYEMNYLNVPLMGKYYLTKGLSVEAGSQIGFLLSAKDENNSIKFRFLLPVSETLRTLRLQELIIEKSEYDNCLIIHRICFIFIRCKI